MMMKTLFGTAKSYPYYVAVYEGKSKKATWVSGVCKTKKKCKRIAVEEVPKVIGTKTKYRYRIIDRRKK